MKRIFIFSLIFSLLPSVVFAATPLYQDWGKDYRVYQLDEFTNQAIVGRQNFWDDQNNVYQPVENVAGLLAFPEGKQIDVSKPYKLADCPTWGVCSVDDKLNEAYIYDKKGNLIYKYTTPVYSKVDPKIETTKGAMTETKIDEKLVEPATFSFDGVSLYFNPLKDTAFKGLVSIYDDFSDTSSTKANYLEYDGVANNVNHGTQNIIGVGHYGAGGGAYKYRPVITFTTPASLGTITSAAVKLYRYQASGSDNAKAQMFTETRSDWSENQSTWIEYKTGSNWTSPGGDYSGLKISENTINSTTGTWDTYCLTVDCATNAITVNWSTTYDWLIKSDNETGTNYINWYSNDVTDQTKRPYLEITYTASGGGGTTTPATSTLNLFSTSTLLNYFLTNYWNSLAIIVISLTFFAFLVSILKGLSAIKKWLKTNI